MLIGEIAKRTGFSRDTLRWYEKIGLIKMEDTHRGDNNYRAYDEKALERLLLIKSMKAFGFTLKETKALFSLEEQNELECNSVGALMKSRLEVIEEEINRLSALKSKILLARNTCSGDCREALATFS